MSKVKSYYESLSERTGYGGEISEQFMEAVGSGQIRNCIQIVFCESGDYRFVSQSDAKGFREELAWTADAWNCEPREAEKRLRAGEVCVTDGYVRMMIIK